jgi:hypothetical protein
MLHQAFYWLGVVTFSLAAIIGLLEGGLLVLDRIVKTAGIWPDVLRVMNKMTQEKLAAKNSSGE